MKNIAIQENHLYSKAYAKGKRFSGRFLSIFVLHDYAAEKLKRANPQKQYVNRIGLSVSKKIGGAVQRNRAKRVIRAAMFDMQKDHPIQTGWLIVISPRQTITEPSVKSPAVMRELLYGFRKLGLTQQTTGQTNQ